MKHLLVALACFVSLSVFGEVSKVYEVKFNASQLTFSKEDGYNVVRLKGTQNISEIGSPSLPELIESFVIPPDASIQDVEIVSFNKEQLPGTYNIFPAQHPVPISYKVEYPFTQPNPKIYGLNTEYPEKLVEVVSTGVKHGFRIVNVAIYPVRYIPSQGVLYLYTNIRFRLKYKRNMVIPTGINTRHKDMFINEIKSLVKNPEDVEKFSPPEVSRFRSKALPPDTVDYVIITDNATDSAYWVPLQYWKTKKGVPARIVTLTYIYANYTGVDNPDKIRNFIKDANTTWGTVWFLLAGQCDFENGEEIIPRRDVYCMTSGAGYYPDEDTIPCDLYYANLDGTWDGNNNGVYGESGDNVDLYPDVYVGRAPVKNVSQITNFVNKVLNYEKNPPATNFAKKILLPAVMLFSSSNWGGDSVNNVIANIVPSGWEKAKLYDMNDNATWDLHGAVIDSTNAGFGFIHHADHGNENGHYYYQGNVVYDYSDADAARNGVGKGYSIMTSISCFCGAVDEVSGGDCMAEHFVNRADSGAVADIANSRYGWGSGSDLAYSEVLDTTFYYEIFYNRDYHIGDALFDMKDALAGDASSDNTYRWCVYETNLFGDPELPLWTDNPDTLDVTHNATVSPGNFTVTVYDNDGVTPIDSARVTLWCKQDNAMYVRGYTDASGNVTLAVNPTIDQDTMWVTATKYENNYLPYEGYAIVNLGAPSCPTVITLFDNAKVPTTTPTLKFSSTDPQGDDIEYMVYWDTLSTFATPESATTPTTYVSGATGSYTFATPLVDGKTYYWKVKGKDPSGSNLWGPFSSARSFTIDTGLPTGTCSWFQTKNTQWQKDTLNNAVIDGDSIILPATGGYITDTLINEDFEGGAMPAGWSVVDGNTDNYKWTVGTTGAMGSYTPPAYGTYYAYYDDDAAGNGVINNNEELISPAVYIPAGTDSLKIEYGYGFRVYETGETYDVKVRFHKSGVWGSWTIIKTYTSSISGTETIDLTANLPADSVQFDWIYHDETSSSHWGYASSTDNVYVIRKYALTNTAGSITGTPVVFSNLAYVDSRTGWGNIIWNKSQATDSISVQVEYLSGGVWALVPDADLSGNSSGFFTTAVSETLSINTLNTTTYDTIRVIGNLYRPSAKASTEPSLISLEVGNLTGFTAIYLNSFTAYSVPEGVRLSWRMETEAGITRYEIARGSEDEVIGKVIPRGISTPVNYTYTDKHPGVGKKNYWLKVVSSDGRKKIYGPYSVIARGGLTYGMKILNSNLASKGIKISYTIPEKVNVNIDVYDITGRKVSELFNGEREAGRYILKWNGTNRTGIYFIKFTAGEYKKTERMIILK